MGVGAPRRDRTSSLYRPASESPPQRTQNPPTISCQVPSRGENPSTRLLDLLDPRCKRVRPGTHRERVMSCHPLCTGCARRQLESQSGTRGAPENYTYQAYVEVAPTWRRRSADSFGRTFRERCSPIYSARCCTWRAPFHRPSPRSAWKTRELCFSHPCSRTQITPAATSRRPCAAAQVQIRSATKSSF